MVPVFEDYDRVIVKVVNRGDDDGEREEIIVPSVPEERDSPVFGRQPEEFRGFLHLGDAPLA